VVLDLGYVRMRWFDAVTAANRFLVTHRREEVADRTVQELSCGVYARDECLEGAGTHAADLGLMTAGVVGIMDQQAQSKPG
jgi:hypothetical protein